MGRDTDTDSIARFNILSSIIVGVTALICLLAPGVNASTAGFALAFANSIQHDLLFVVRRFVQLEQSMVALERIKEWVLLSLYLTKCVVYRSQ